MKNSKTLAIALLLGLVATIPLAGQAATPTTLIAPDVTTPPSVNVSLTTLLDNSTVAIAAVAYSICFDPSVVMILDVVESAAVSALNNGAGPSFSVSSIGTDNYQASIIVDFIGMNAIPPSPNFELFESTYEAIGSPGEVSPLEFCINGNPPAPPSVVNDGTSATLIPTLSNGSITINNIGGALSLTVGGSPTMGAEFDLSVLLSTVDPVEGFRFGLSHDQAQVSPVAVAPSPAVLAVNGGAGPDFFVVDMAPLGGTGLTVDCDLSTTGSAALPPAPTAIVDVTYEAFVNAGACPTAEFEIRADLGVPIELDLSSGPILTTGASTSVVIQSSPLAVPSGGVTLEVVSSIGALGSIATVPVTLDADVEVQGFAFSAEHSSPEYVLMAIEPGADLATLDCQNGPDFFGVSIPGGGTEFGSVVAVLDLDPAGLAEVLPAASDLEVARFRYQIPLSATVDPMVISLVDGLGTPPLAMEVTSDFAVILPQTVSGTLGSGGSFRRGDCNSDGTFNIADAINLLGTLFPSGPVMPITCDDACDTNDDGGINIADAIFSLGVLFGGSILPAPTSCGADPTGDSLDCISNGPC